MEKYYLAESVVIMDKLLDGFLAVVFTACLVLTVPVSACSNGNGMITGGACSVKDLNKLSGLKIDFDKQDKVSLDLRPVKLEEAEKISAVDLICKYKVCLLKLNQK